MPWRLKRLRIPRFGWTGLPENQRPSAASSLKSRRARTHMTERGPEVHSRALDGGAGQGAGADSKTSAAARKSAAPKRRAWPQSVCRSGEHFVFLEPGDHLVPAVLGRVLAVAGAIVGVEAVRRGGVDLDLAGFSRA